MKHISELVKEHVSLTSVNELVASGKIDYFLKKLSENLCLSDLLCGEADPLDFLKSEFSKTYYETLAESAENRALTFRKRSLSNETN